MWPGSSLYILKNLYMCMVDWRGCYIWLVSLFSSAKKAKMNIPEDLDCGFLKFFVN